MLQVPSKQNKKKTKKTRQTTTKDKYSSISFYTDQKKRTFLYIVYTSSPTPEEPRGVPLWCSGLRIQHYYCSGFGHCGGVGSIPDPGTSTYAANMAKRKKERNREKKLLKFYFRCFAFLETLSCAA